MKKLLVKSISVCCAIMFTFIFFSYPGNVFAFSMKSEKIPLYKEFMQVNFSYQPQTLQRNEENKLLFPYSGMSTLLEFNDSVNHSLVNYTTSNSNVAVAYDGRILATGKGTAQITITYSNQQIEYDVIVKENMTADKLAIIAQNSTQTSPVLLSESSERTEIVNKALDMVYYRWVPTSNLIGWEYGHTFTANSLQSGIPYSQYNQVDEIEFASAMGNSDFYTGYTNSYGEYMPRYGNDCSGFVAICWDLPYQGSSRYNTTKFRQEYSSIGGYSNLEAGDALVTVGHIFLVGMNYQIPPSGSPYNESYVACYEQTPPKSMLTFWTYNQLENQNYVPISKF